MHATLALGLLLFAHAKADIEALVFQLRSPDQKLRDAAAEQLRESYVASNRAKWEPLVASIKPGMQKTDLWERLQPIEPEGGPGTGRSHMETYRLDDRWVVYCWLNNADESLHSIDLVEHMRPVWVAPPKDFTGAWITYYVNGQKSNEIDYKDGKYDGTFISYRWDGSKNYVQHYVMHKGEGEDVGYYLSGKVRYRGIYRNGKPAGVWTHYNEDGTVFKEERQPE